MAFFKTNKGSQNELSLEDRKWINANIHWLIESFGYHKMVTGRKHVVDELSFPNMTQNDELNLSGLIRDLCTLLEVDEKRIVVHQKGDMVVLKPILTVHDGTSTPFHITLGVPKITDREVLVLRLLVIIGRIRMKEEEIELDETDDNASLLYLLLIYHGFGVLLCSWKENELTITGSVIPQIFQEYCLAYISWVSNESNPEWGSQLPKTFQLGFKKQLHSLFKQRENQALISQFKSMDQANDQLKNCWHLYRNGHFELAASLADELAEKFTQDAIIINAAGFFHLRLKNYNRAIPMFETAMAINPEFNEPFNNLGFAYLMTHDFEAGRKYIEKSMELDPNDPFCFRNLGVYFSIHEEFTLADQHFQKALAIDPEIELIYYYMGLSKIREGKMDDAVTLFEKSKQKNERESIFKLAEIHRLNQNLEEGQ